MRTVTGPGGTAHIVASKRERQVLRLVRIGRTNREIAAELRIKEHTARNYVSRWLIAAGVSNRVQLCAWTHVNPAVIEGCPAPPGLDSQGGVNRPIWPLPAG